jgi:hypothetical protein
MKRPNFFVVGAPKCGTSALYEYLKGHPEIFMSPIKELHFFSRDVFYDYRPWRLRTLADYLGCFREATTQKCIGECSPTYLGSRSAPDEIKAFNPTARIIIMLRNPAEMMYALHSQHIWDTTEPILDFEAALEADEKWNSVPCQPQSWRLPCLGYRESARFVEQVRNYFRVFGRECVHVIIYDDFTTRTHEVFQDALRFLGVNPDFQPDFRVVNSSHRARSPRLQRFFVQQLAPFAWIVPRRIRRAAGRSLIRLNTVQERRPPMDPELKRRLLEEFYPEVEELSNLLGRNLTSWCKVAGTFN